MQRTTRPHSLNQCAHVSLSPHPKVAVFTAPVAVYTFIQSLLTGLSPHLHGKHRRGGHLASWLAVAFPAPKTGQVQKERTPLMAVCPQGPSPSHLSPTHPPSQQSLDVGGFFKEEGEPQSCQVIYSGPLIGDRASQWSGPLGSKDYPLGLVVIQLLNHIQFCDPTDCSPPGSMGFSRQEYCSRLPFPFPGDHPRPGIKSRLLH